MKAEKGLILTAKNKQANNNLNVNAMNQGKENDQRKKNKEITDHIIALTDPLNEYNLANYPNLPTKDYEITARAALTLFQRRRDHLARMKPEGITALVRVALRHANNASENK